MRQLLQFLKYLWNGGLDPASADSAELRQRRTISTTSLLLLPVALALILANILVFDASEQNLPIIVVVLLAVLGVYLQASRGWVRFAISALIGSFWIAPTILMLEVGFNSSNWAWLLPVALLGHLLGDQRIALTWAVVGLLTLWILSVLTTFGYLAISVDTNNHTLAVTISGTLIFLMIYLAGFSFRVTHNRIDQELKKNLQCLADEVEVRRQAETAALAGEKSKAVFLTTISHELRTPLNGVIGAGQLLAETKLNKEQQELMKLISDSGDILLELINNVLDFSRLNSGKLDLESRPINLSSLLSASVAPLMLLAKQKSVELSYKIAPDVASYVDGDVVRLRQILLNLCGNALKFTDSGSVEINVENNNQGLLFTVKDTGIGFTDDIKHKLFQPFEQADSSTSRRFGGSGLGLAIVAEIVELMDGDICVDSQAGVGSTFTVSLPLPPSASQELTQANEQNENGQSLEDKVSIDNVSKSRTVLVTDDNRVNRVVASKMLRQLGYKVVEASDGFEAIDIVAKQDVDIILMDVQMPNMDGVAATTRIRAMQSPKAKIPIVGLTANAMPTDKQAVLDSGMNYYLSKPVRLDQLKNALSTFF